MSQIDIEKLLQEGKTKEQIIALMAKEIEKEMVAIEAKKRKIQPTRAEIAARVAAGTEQIEDILYLTYKAVAPLVPELKDIEVSWDDICMIADELRLNFNAIMEMVAAEVPPTARRSQTNAEIMKYLDEYKKGL